MGSSMVPIPARRAAKKDVKRGGLPTSQVKAFAEQKAFRYLEQRWRKQLHGRRIPKNYRRKMRQDPHFQILVSRVLSGDGLVDDDLDHTPVVERLPDGTVRNRMEEELGGDPRAYFCPECGEEMEEASGGPCSSCTKDHQRLYGD